MRPNLQFSADLVIFTEEILKGRLDFLCSKVQYGKSIDLSLLKLKQSEFWVTWTIFLKGKETIVVVYKLVMAIPAA